jgi:hypothetical protein
MGEKMNNVGPKSAQDHVAAASQPMMAARQTGRAVQALGPAPAKLGPCQPAHRRAPPTRSPRSGCPWWRGYWQWILDEVFTYSTRVVQGTH